MAILWSSSLEIGIRQIDLQHRELVEIINDLELVHTSGVGTPTLEDVLSRLKAYALFHFNEEETLAVNIAAEPMHTAGHIAEHREFAAKLSAFRVDQPEAVADLMHYLQSWLPRHILQTDRQLAEMHHAHRRANLERREA